jgi:protein-arginine deiminase
MPAGARTMLEQQGRQWQRHDVSTARDWQDDPPPLVSTKCWPTRRSAAVEAAVNVDAQMEILKKELGNRRRNRSDSVPHADEEGSSIAYQPEWSAYHGNIFASPDPHGPVIGGKDIFKSIVETRLAAHGIQTMWVEDWDLYHMGIGEVHCGSNTQRKVPTNVKWWETGR